MHIEFIIFGQLIHLLVKMRFVNLNRVSMLQFFVAAVRVKLIELIKELVWILKIRVLDVF